MAFVTLPPPSSPSPLHRTAVLRSRLSMADLDAAPCPDLSIDAWMRVINVATATCVPIRGP